METIEAQAKPTPTMGSHNRPGSRIRKTPNRPAAPSISIRAWVALRPIRLARTGRVKAARAATPL